MSSSASGVVRPPIQIFGLEGRYATALYSAASKLKQLESVEKELTQVQDAIKKSPRLKEVITSPIISRGSLTASLRDFSTKAKVSSATSNLLSLLAENGRLKKLDGVINAFKTIMAAHRGEVVCEITSARPLEAAQRKQLEDVLKVRHNLPNETNNRKLIVIFLFICIQKFVKPNETILLKTHVDPTVLGGLVVSIGDKYVDLSVATKVKKYTSLIENTA